MMDTDLFIPLSLAALLLPLSGFVLVLFFGSRLPRNGDWLGTSLIGAAWLISLLLLAAKLISYPTETLVRSAEWVVIGDERFSGVLTVEFGILIDNITVVMLFVVTLVSFLVHLFSVGYMEGDVRYGRYFAYLGLFSFSMIGIVLTHNLLFMYMFWELVGISSYLLIGHWYEKKSASNAATKAFIVNRVGDAGMFAGILILFAGFSTFAFENLFDSVAAGALPFGSTGWLTAAGLLIFCGAVGKSAQLPLHVWLPDAMEGPTPVSALIHAATMVAAGVYLVARIFPLLTADALLVIAYTGAITALVAATVALTQYDIKKVLAYSTISQLGYMIMALGVGAYTAGIMHLVTHAWFKAGLFLGAGSVIYAMHKMLHDRDDHETDAQDIRSMGGLRHRMPYTYFTFLIFTLAISGVPLTSGFLSKDEILAGTLAFGMLSGHYLLPLIGFVVAALTALYMFRLLILVFHGPHDRPERLAGVSESPRVMTIPLLVLASLSLFLFYSPTPFGAAQGWFYGAVERPLSVVPGVVEPVAAALLYETVSLVHTPVMVLSIVLALTGIAAALLLYQWKKIRVESVVLLMGRLYRGARELWYFDRWYQALFVEGTLRLTDRLKRFDDNVIDGFVNRTADWTGSLSNVSKWIDVNMVDGLVHLAANAAGRAGSRIRRLQTGRIQTYLVYVVFSFIVLFVLIMQPWKL